MHTAFCHNDFFDTVGFYFASIATTESSNINYNTNTECTWSLESQLCTIYIEQTTIKRNVPSCSVQQASNEDVEFHSNCKLKDRSTIKIRHEFLQLNINTYTIDTCTRTDAYEQHLTHPITDRIKRQKLHYTFSSLFFVVAI